MPAVQACVLAFNPRSGTGTQTVSGVVDHLGNAFTGRLLIPIGAYAANGVLTTSGNAACWNIGIDTGSLAGSSGSADVAVELFFPPSVLKISDTGQSTNRSLLDTGAQLFFGGYIARLGKVTGFASGSFDLSYDQNDRSGDTIICMVLGGDALNLDTFNNLLNTTYTTTAAPVGVLCLPIGGGLNSSAGAANGSNGAGGRSLGIGWDTKVGGRGSATQVVVNQGGNTRQQDTTTLCLDASTPIVSTWGASSYAVTGSNGGGSTVQIAFSGTGVSVNAGVTTQPAAAGPQTIALGVAPRLVLFLSYGTTAQSGQLTDSAETSFGFADRGGRQCSLWVGENGVQPTVNGARLVSNATVLRFGTPAGSSTTFPSVASVASMSEAGTVTLNWAASDGVPRQILWFVLGEVTVPVGEPGCVSQLTPTAIIPPAGCANVLPSA